MPARTALGTIALLAATALAPGQALGDHVSCGQVITKNTKLDSDLSCVAEQPALTIGADRVKLDLAGHLIFSPLHIGILNDGNDRVTIKRGRVSSPFGSPIVVRDANRNRLRDLVTGGGGGPGLRLDASDRNRIVGGVLGADTGGVVLTNGSDRNVIARNDLSAGIGSGLAIFDSDRNVVRRNFGFPGEGDALLVGEGSDGTTVVRNQLSSGFRDGLVVRAETTDTLLVRNEVHGYGDDGIQVDSASTTLARNSSNDNGGWGILAVPGVVDEGGNTASGNGAGQCQNVSC